MGWGKFDDGYPDHPKIDPLSDGAYRLHSTAILYSTRVLTNGVVSDERLPRLTPRYKASHLKELVDVGLFERVDGGYYIHDYHDYNPEAEEVLAKREADRERKAAERAKGTQNTGRDKDGTFVSKRTHPPGVPKDVQLDIQADIHQDGAMESEEVSTATRPDPSRPDTDISNSVVDFGDEPPPGDWLVARMMRVIGVKNSKTLDESENVIRHCRQYVSDTVIDEALGWCATQSERSQWPSAVFEAIRTRAENRGLDVPAMRVRTPS